MFMYSFRAMSIVKRDLIISTLLCSWPTVTDVAGEVIEVGSAVRYLKVGDKVLSKLKFGVTPGIILRCFYFTLVGLIIMCAQLSLYSIPHE